jgi:phosphoribosylanthranilate isomerase
MTSQHLVVKICGLRTAPLVDTSLEAGADMIGLVHFEKSPRHVAAQDLRPLADRARGRAAVVLLTVDAGDDLLARLVETARPDFVQLHGGETPERAAAIRDRYGVGVIKAVGVSSAGDVAAAARFDGAVDWLLFDARPPKDATRPGGLGTAFDWSLLDGRARHPAGSGATPFLLSGGLGPTNVGQAVARVRPGGVDVSSGVERAPGEKDEGLIRAFVSAARAAAVADPGESIEEHVR